MLNYKYFPEISLLDILQITLLNKIWIIVKDINLHKIFTDFPALVVTLILDLNVVEKVIYLGLLPW